MNTNDRVESEIDRMNTTGQPLPDDKDKIVYLRMRVEQAEKENVDLRKQLVEMTKRAEDLSEAVDRLMDRETEGTDDIAAIWNLCVRKGDERPDGNMVSAISTEISQQRAEITHLEASIAEAVELLRNVRQADPHAAFSMRSMQAWASGCSEWLAKPEAERGKALLERLQKAENECDRLEAALAEADWIILNSAKKDEFLCPCANDDPTDTTKVLGFYQFDNRRQTWLHGHEAERGLALLERLRKAELGSRIAN